MAPQPSDTDGRTTPAEQSARPDPASPPGSPIPSPVPSPAPSDHGGIQLSAAQVAASGAAAVCAAFLASFAGLAGTLIGTAVTSVVATVATTVYGHWFRTSNAVLRRHATTLTGRIAPPARRPRLARLVGGDGTTRRRIAVVAVGALSAFALAAVVVTGVEAASGKPLSKVVSGGSGGGTTFGKLTNPSSKRATPTRSTTPTTITTPSVAPSPSAAVPAAPLSPAPTPDNAPAPTLAVPPTAAG